MEERRVMGVGEGNTSEYGQPHEVCGPAAPWMAEKMHRLTVAFENRLQQLQFTESPSSVSRAPQPPIWLHRRTYHTHVGKSGDPRTRWGGPDVLAAAKRTRWDK